VSERLTARLGVAATRDAVAAVPVDQLVAAVTALAIDDAMLACFAAGYQITDLSAEVPAGRQARRPGWPIS
jgi:hypothetical protein